MTPQSPEERLARLEANQETHDKLFDRLSSSLDRLVDRFDKTEKRLLVVGVLIFASTGNGAAVAKAIGAFLG